MPNSYPRDGIFNAHIATIKDPYNPSLVFNEDRKIPTTRLAEFPTGTVDPRVEIFLSTLNINDRFFFFFHIPLDLYKSPAYIFIIISFYFINCNVIN